VPEPHNVYPLICWNKPITAKKGLVNGRRRRRNARKALFARMETEVDNEENI